MSADNYIYVRQHAGGWAVGEEFASDEPGPVTKQYSLYTTKDEALRYASRMDRIEFYEYGVVVEGENEDELRAAKSADGQAIAVLVRSMTNDCGCGRGIYGCEKCRGEFA